MWRVIICLISRIIARRFAGCLDIVYAGWDDDYVAEHMLDGAYHVAEQMSDAVYHVTYAMRKISKTQYTCIYINKYIYIYIYVCMYRLIYNILVNRYVNKKRYIKIRRSILHFVLLFGGG